MSCGEGSDQANNACGMPHFDLSCQFIKVKRLCDLHKTPVARAGYNAEKRTRSHLGLAEINRRIYEIALPLRLKLNARYDSHTTSTV